MRAATPLLDQRRDLFSPPETPKVRGGLAAFTLAELMVVIAIIGVLAAIGIPALRGLGESNAIDAATRQILDDLGFARLRAINDRATVYMLFVPLDVHEQSTNLAPYRQTGYTLFSRRSVGEQPGRQSPRQLIPWRTLPDQTFFPITKLLSQAVGLNSTNEYEQPYAYTNNFPLILTNRLYPNMGMFYLAFNPQGQVVRFDGSGRSISGRNEYVAIVRGSIFHPRDSNGQYIGIPDSVEIPQGNRRYIRVNWLTGRAEVLGDLVTDSSGTRQRIQGEPE